MSYLVLARKYRPQTFEEIVKQDHISKTLTNAISIGRVSHAILFTGPRGTGKTTVARILAKAMNCVHGPLPVPCNECTSCVEIKAGNSPDVFEIDGASNNSVDQVRELRENVKYMPAHGKYKIYIIDEVHMLSIAAFNALLKTLEEPPSHVMFIFATTEPNKIPITILSRCQRHDFRRIDIEALSKHMTTLCSMEGFEMDKESVDLIARESDGSMRDALSLLDQVMACMDGKITHDQVLDMLGIADRRAIFGISDAVIQGDVHVALDILDSIYDRGQDIRKLYSDLLEHFRNLLVVKIGKNINKLVNLPAHEIALLIDHAKKAPVGYLNQLFELFFREESSIKFSSQPKFALEMIFLRLYQIKPSLTIDELIEKLDNLRKEVSGNPAEGDAGVLAGAADPVERFVSEEPGKEENTGDSGSVPDTRKADSGSFQVGQDDDLDSVWESIHGIIVKTFPPLAANLANTKLKHMSEKGLVIEVTGSSFSINMVKRNKNLETINNVCDEFFGRKMELIVETKQRSNEENREQKSRENNLKKDALRQQLVKEAVEVFNGRVTDIKIL